MSNENVRPAKKNYLQTKEGRRNVINCVIADSFCFRFTG